MNDSTQLGEYKFPPEASYKEATGPYQVKLFCIGEDGPLYPVGSGTLLSINNRNFIITCWHVIQKANAIENVAFYEPTPDDKARPIRSSSIYLFKNEDIAFLEIEPSYVPYLKTKQVASYGLINNQVTMHLTSISTVILHAVPYERTDLSFEKKEITLNTFPYVTFGVGRQ
ncbi:S1 family peptidase [Geobacter sp. 60473]|uniref:S1 family peptidase n=1 Tax=Geobacter sp. 60473 TaxID=3080755 RepID=UPI002B3222A4|nr:hypothetical protein GEO60473_05710 [Geobacter sp. 60473]